MLASLAQAARASIHRPTLRQRRPPHREAAFKAVGRALRRRGGTRRRRPPVDEGAVVRVAICEYGAGKCAVVEIAFRRLGAELIGDPYEADLAVLPASARPCAMDGLRARGHDSRIRRRFAEGRLVLASALPPVGRSRRPRKTIA